MLRISHRPKRVPHFMTQSDFLVSKWYADVIDAQTGNVVILYHSELTWKKLGLRFSNSLQFLNRKKLHSVASFTTHFNPTLTGNLLSVNDAKITGQWTALRVKITEKLFEDSSGYILWECFMPLAEGNVRFGQKNRNFQGFGYVERLIFSVKPWEMPITVLRWGRFLSENQSVVWIRWEGKAERNLIFHNGQKYTDGQIEDDEVRFGSFRLLLTEKCTLRNGSLITTVFRKFGWLKKLFPEGILNLQECKWQTRSQLYQNQDIISTGWTIHERVEWV